MSETISSGASAAGAGAPESQGAQPGPCIGAFSNSFAALPEPFYVRQPPAPVRQPALLLFNEALAAALGLDPAAIAAADPAALFAGNILPAGADPLAMAYAGHQFGGFVPQLGDGRALLLGEVIDRDGVRRDIQLKGSGRTAFSRGGDGRAALGPVLREYLVSEAMHALGIPTTRALAAVGTGEVVLRGRALPGAVLTRVLASNIRVGTFQYFAARGDSAALRVLADYVINRHYPDLAAAPDRYLGLLAAVQERQAALIAAWLQIGFVHGVMNTDNMAISGETIDFGPCAFMDAYDPATVFSSIDERGRYAYGNQPRIAQWNLARFAETLLPLIDDDTERAVAQAMTVIDAYPASFERLWLQGMREKLGLYDERPGDRELINTLLELLHQQGADFTGFFRRLAGAARPGSGVACGEDSRAFDPWLETWRARLDKSLPPELREARMRRKNPAFIPRNGWVETLLAAAEAGDLAPMREALAILQRPFDEQPAFAHHAEPPAKGALPYVTFCGT